MEFYSAGTYNTTFCFLPVTELNHSGEVLKRYILPAGVKCIVGDGEFLYAGCNNGALYGKTVIPIHILVHLIATLNFSMGFNIIAPYMGYVTHK